MKHYSSPVFILTKTNHHPFYSKIEVPRSSSLNTSNVSSINLKNMINPSERSLINSHPLESIRFFEKQGSTINIPSPKKSINQYYTTDTHLPDNFKTIYNQIEDLVQKNKKNQQDILSFSKIINQKQLEKKINQKYQEFAEKYHLQHTIGPLSAEISILKKQISTLKNVMKLQTNQKSYERNLATDEKQLIKMKSVMEERIKQETLKIRRIIENQVNKINHEFRWELQKDNRKNGIKSKLKYPFKPIKIQYSEFLQTSIMSHSIQEYPTLQDNALYNGLTNKGNKKSSMNLNSNNNKGSNNHKLSTAESVEDEIFPKRVLNQNQLIYFIDHEGYLLDEDNYYLLNSEQKMIKISEEIQQKLRFQNILNQK